MQEASEFWDLMTEEYVRGYIHAQERQFEFSAYLSEDIDDELYMIYDNFSWHIVDTPTAVRWGL